MSQRTCAWCWANPDYPLVITVTGEEVSPTLCHDCTDEWDEGQR